MKKTISFLSTAIITIIMCMIIAPSAFAEDTVYTTSDVTGGVRIDSVTTTETIFEIPEEIDGKMVVALGGKAFSGTPVEEITVPASVTSMNSYISGDYSAFYGMDYLEKVTFAEGMKAVPASALMNCNGVKEVVLPESLTSISDYAFYGCTSLTTINLPDSITSIGEEAFYNCTSLASVELPEELKEIYDGAFALCSKIKAITLPDSLTKIEGLAFYKTQISEITVPANVTTLCSYEGINNVPKKDYSVFFGMDYLEKVTFAEGMKTVPASALMNCNGVKEVVLPESLTSISDYAFYGCSSLTTINLPDSITFIGEEAFYNCTSLESVELPEELKEIHDGAFALCSKIKAITLPDTLTKIEGLAFYKTQISEITVPANVTTLCSYEGINNVPTKDYSAFCEMDYLEKVTFAEGMKAVPASALMNCNGVKEVVLSESLTSISDYAFYGCTSLTTINLPDSITFIGEESFYNCTSLESVELPEELKEIHDGAFALCSKIKAITLPDSLTKIEGLAFYKTQISEITVPANVTTLYSYEGINNVPKKDYSAFYGMDYLEKVIFSEGMKSLPYGALTSCTSVTEVVLPESLMMISDYSFYNCTALKNINFPDSVVSIGNSAFYNCKSLTDVELSSSLTSIDKYAFEGCKKLEEIVLPENVTNLGIRVFYGTKISEIIIPAGMEKMHGYTEFLSENGWAYDHENYSSLYGMQFLTKITFSDGMNVIPKNATYGCFYLKEVVIYDCNTSLESMQADAESGGYKLTVLPCGECTHENTETRDAVAVTCLENGYTGDTYCTDCDELLAEGEIITAAGRHSYKSETVKTATCEAEGEIKYTCTVCGDNYTEMTAKAPSNHTGDTQIRDTKEATCSEKGYTGDKYCSDCGILLKKGSETSKTAHTEVKINGYVPTCSEKGLTDGTKCSVCDKVIKEQKEISAKGHSYGKWVTVKAPTTTEEGREERKCSVCGATESRTITKADYIIGDVNGDKKITAADARIVLRISAKLENIEKYNLPFIVFDIISDNKITAADARKILRISAKLE